MLIEVRLDLRGRRGGKGRCFPDALQRRCSSHQYHSNSYSMYSASLGFAKLICQFRILTVSTEHTKSCDMGYCDIGGRSISPTGSEEHFRKTAPLPPPASPEVEPHLDQHQETDSKAPVAETDSYV